MPRPPSASWGVLSIPFRVEPGTRSGPTWDPRRRAGLAFLGRLVEAVALPGPHPSTNPYPLQARMETLRSPPATPAWSHQHRVPTWASGPAGPRWATCPSTVSWAGPRFPPASRAQACPVLEPRARPLPPTPSLPFPLDKQDVGGTGSPSPRAGRGAGTAGPALPLLMEKPDGKAHLSLHALPRDPTSRTRAPP